MKVTSELRKQIYRAVRENVAGASPFAEVGERDDRTGQVIGNVGTVNALAWGDWDDNPNVDFCSLKNLTAIPEVAGLEGRAFLDIYVTTGTGSNRELETNVYVAIVGGRVVAATCNDLDAEKIERIARQG